MPQMIIANRLRDGVVVFLAPDETWVPANLQLGVLVRTELLGELPQVSEEPVTGAAVLVGDHLAAMWWVGAFENERST